MPIHFVDNIITYLRRKNTDYLICNAGNYIIWLYVTTLEYIFILVSLLFASVNIVQLA